MGYKIEFTRTAERQISSLPKQTQVRIGSRIDELSQDPRPPKCKKLEGEEALYRIRIGDYRVIYQIQDKKLLVLVVKVGDRKEIYRR